MEHLETTRMLTMCKPANNPYSAPEYAASLVRAEALDYGIAIEGLMRIREREPGRVAH